MKQTISDSDFKDVRVEETIIIRGQKSIVSIWTMGTGHFFEARYTHEPSGEVTIRSRFKDIHDAMEEFNSW